MREGKYVILLLFVFLSLYFVGGELDIEDVLQLTFSQWSEGIRLSTGCSHLHVGSWRSYI